MKVIRIYSLGTGRVYCILTFAFYLCFCISKRIVQRRVCTQWVNVHLRSCVYLIHVGNSKCGDGKQGHGVQKKWQYFTSTCCFSWCWFSILREIFPACAEHSQECRRLELRNCVYNRMGWLANPTLLIVMIFNVFLYPLLSNKGEGFNEYEFGYGKEMWRTEVIHVDFSSEFHPPIDKTEFHLTF